MNTYNRLSFEMEKENVKSLISELGGAETSAEHTLLFPKARMCVDAYDPCMARTE